MKKILSIEDEHTLLECFRIILDSRGYEPHVTHDPEAGLALLEREDISLVLLDVRIPGKRNGFQIYSEIRESFKRLPVLFVTAYPQMFASRSEEVETMWERDFAVGVTDVLYKPFSLDMFIEKVEALIHRVEVADQDVDTCKDVRRVLIGEWIDLGRLSFRAEKGQVSLHGRLQRLSLDDAALAPHEVGSLFSGIEALPGVQGLSVSLENWVRKGDTWRSVKVDKRELAAR